MSLDYSSYNSLTVPLDIGTWECTLMLGSEYSEHARQRQWSRRDLQRDTQRTHSQSWPRSSSAFDRDDDEEAERRQLEDDRRIFLQYFRPNYDFRRLIATDSDAITSFLRDHLNVAHWNLPTDNAGIERALKQAVTDGKLVPIINRDRRMSARTYRPTPGPLRWPSSGGGESWNPLAYLFPPGTTQFNGEPVLSGPYDPAAWSKLNAARVAVSGANSGNDGGSLLGVVEAVASAVLGSSDTDGAGADGSDLAADADASSPLGDAQPFEYTPDAVSGDVEDLAAKTTNPDYAAKMLGYDRDTFGDMIHDMKDGLGLGGADNVIWHDSGDIEFKGKIIGNMHDY